MKKLLFAAVAGAVMLCGCTTAELVELNGNNCFQVFQTLNEGALARRCTSVIGSGSPVCTGAFVAIPNSFDNQLYDEKIVCMKEPQVTGRYTYTTVKNVVKTVPVYEDIKPEE